MEGKFTDVQHRQNILTNVRENRLRNPNLSLVTPIRPPRQSGDLKRLLMSLKEEGKQEATFCQWDIQEYVYCKYKQLSSKTKVCPQFAVCNFSARHYSLQECANLTMLSIFAPVIIALGYLMIEPGVLLLLSAIFLLQGALKLNGPFTLFHIW